MDTVPELPRNQPIKLPYPLEHHSILIIGVVVDVAHLHGRGGRRRGERVRMRGRKDGRLRISDHNIIIKIYSKFVNDDSPNIIHIDALSAIPDSDEARSNGF